MWSSSLCVVDMGNPTPLFLHKLSICRITSLILIGFWFHFYRDRGPPGLLLSAEFCVTVLGVSDQPHALVSPRGNHVTPGRAGFLSLPNRFDCFKIHFSLCSCKCIEVL